MIQNDGGEQTKEVKALHGYNLKFTKLQLVKEPLEMMEIMHSLLNVKLLPSSARSPTQHQLGAEIGMIILLFSHSHPLHPTDERIIQTQIYIKKQL